MTRNGSSQKENSIENSLIQSIADPSIEISPEWLELGLEELANNEAVTKLPVAGTLLAFGKTALAVRNALFVKNILAFLKGVHTVKPKMRKDWLSKLKNDNFQKKVGEELLNIIDKLKDVEKNEIAGKIFAVYIEGRIDYPSVIKLCEKLDRLFKSDIHGLKTAMPNHIEDKERFLSIGLYVRSQVTGQLSGNPSFITNKELLPSNDCRLLVELIRSD